MSAALIVEVHSCRTGDHHVTVLIHLDWDYRLGILQYYCCDNAYILYNMSYIASQLISYCTWLSEQLLH